MARELIHPATVVDAQAMVVMSSTPVGACGYDKGIGTQIACLTEISCAFSAMVGLH